MIKEKRHDKMSDDKPKILWHNSYINGPLTGLALYNGKKCWFEVVDMGVGLPLPNNVKNILSGSELHVDTDSDSGSGDESYDVTISEESDEDSSSDEEREVPLYFGRSFNFYELSEASVKLIEDDHEEFRQKVGYHTEHDIALYKPLKLNYVQDENKMIHLIFNHTVDPDELKGDFIYRCYDSEIENYYLPNSSYVSYAE